MDQWDLFRDGTEMVLVMVFVSGKTWIRSRDGW